MWDAFLDEKGRIIFDSFDLNWKTDSDFKITSFTLSTYAALKTNQSHMHSDAFTLENAYFSIRFYLAKSIEITYIRTVFTVEKFRENGVLSYKCGQAKTVAFQNVDLIQNSTSIFFRVRRRR